MNKNAQIAYFILFALGILIGALFVFHVSNEDKTKAEEALLPDIDAQPIRQFIELCMKETGKEAILFVSERGGYYDPGNKSYHSLFFDVPYYFYRGFGMNPNRDQIERQISGYMNENLFFCLRNFADFKKFGYSMDAGNLKLKTSIVHEAIVFDLESAIKIKSSDASYTLGSMTAELRPIGLYKIITLEELIAREQAKDKNSICVSCILNWSIEHNLSVAMSRLNDSLIRFTITDNSTIIDGKPLSFNFVNSYEMVSCQSPPSDDLNFIQDCLTQQIKNQTLQLKIFGIPDFVAKSEELFFYDVNASGYNVTFRDFSNLFEINHTNGIIRFTPSKSQKGEHTIWVEATDALRHKEFKNFKITIT